METIGSGHGQNGVYTNNARQCTVQYYYSPQKERRVGNVDETWPHRLNEEVSPKAVSFIKLNKKRNA